MMTQDEILRIRRFLLGELSDEGERRRVEERLLLDDEYFREVQAAEDDLIEEYLGGALAPGEREQFERHFMAAPEQRENVRQAQAIRDYFIDTGTAVRPIIGELEDRAVAKPLVVREPLSPRRRFLPSWLGGTPVTVGLALGSTTAAVILAAACALVLWRSWRPGDDRLAGQQSPGELQTQLAEQRKENEGLTKALEHERNGRLELERQIAEMRERAQRAVAGRPPAGRGGVRLPPAPRRDVATLVLSPGQIMSGGERSGVELPPHVRTLRLHLSLEDDRSMRHYSAELHTDEDGRIWRREGLRARRRRTGAVVTVSIPAELLTRREYRVILSGATAAGNYERIGAYTFQVVGG